MMRRREKMRAGREGRGTDRSLEKETVLQASPMLQFVFSGECQMEILLVEREDRDRERSLRSKERCLNGRYLHAERHVVLSSGIHLRQQRQSQQRIESIPNLISSQFVCTSMTTTREIFPKILLVHVHQERTDPRVAMHCRFKDKTCCG
jgi:hypothetical protein